MFMTFETFVVYNLQYEKYSILSTSILVMRMIFKIRDFFYYSHVETKYVLNVKISPPVF